MEEYPTAEVFLGCFSRNFTGEFINVNFIVTRFCFSEHQNRRSSVPSRHAVLSFTITVLLNFLELKYQGKTESPFETHPKTMLVAVISVIMYCFSYDAKLRLSSTHVSPNYVGVVHSSMVFFGLLSLASLSSILFPEPLCPVVFLLSILFSLRELPLKFLRNWLQEIIMAKMCPKQHRQGRRRRRLAESVYRPRLPQYAMVQQVGALPV